MNHIKSLICTVSLCVSSYLLFSQQSKIYSDNQQLFFKALNYYDEEKYSIARYFFEQYQANGNTKELLLSDAAYYTALSALELFHNDAELLLLEYLNQHRENSRVLYAQYKMGLYKYRDKKFKKAIPWFEMVNPYYLSKEEQHEYYFKLGYSYFVNNEYDKAEKCFYEIKDIPNNYHSPALYFYSHIAYTKKNYETALNGFQKLSKDELFAHIVPYYITQIFYLQEKYDQVIAYAPAFLDSANTRRAPEIARIIGESFYRTKRYAEAIPYLERYANAMPLSRADMYQLSYAYYKTGSVQRAAKLLEKIPILDDTLSQQTLYLLADCYLYDGLKNNARMALEKASKMNYDKEIQEEALFQFAKLSFELSYSPFNEAVQSFQAYINQYPNSPRIDEAYKYLSQAFLFSKNYKEAIEALENIRNITPETEEAYQRACFFRGLELFNNQDFEQAIIHFDKSLNNARYNKLYAAQSLYWKGEAFYRLKDYETAMKLFQKFLITPGSYESDVFAMAHYNIAYCYMKQKDYANAQIWFRKYIENENNKERAQIYDSYTRIGDCFFVLRKYEDAIDFYSKSIETKKAAPDYAMYQKAICLGLLKRFNEEIITLNELLDKYPRSTFVDDALLELGNGYLALEEHQMAINAYNKLITDYPKSELVRRAYLQLGLTYFNIDKNQEAIAMYKTVIENYPNTQEYKDAFVGLKNVYLDMNDINTYYTYVNEKGSGISVSIREKDSLTYTVAERVYMTGDCMKASPLLSEYINKYPNGLYKENANYYMGECLFKDKRYDEAYEYYLRVANFNQNMFTEPALLKVGNYQYQKQRYSEAIATFSRLLDIAQYPQNSFAAKTGLMRSNFQLGKYDEANRWAIDILKDGKISDELYREAHFVIGKSAYMQNKFDLALDEFILIAKNARSREEAEAKYLIIDIYFKQNKLDAAEKEVFDFVKKNTPHQYWLAKAFLLLADIYIQKNDNFQAKATLQSIIDNYKNNDDEIKNEARNKLNAILEREKAALLPPQPDNQNMLNNENE
ncbi:MAG: tetratricopeptide repeat protein [Bacteroidales bacterium]|nr:tetratricopeptide repeat protein [Bacteroidales bacterium]